MTDDLFRHAVLEIDGYRERLVPAALVEQQMQRLALEFQGMGQGGAGESHATLLRAAAYLRRVAEWDEVDPRLRLDCVCTLCWTKREETLDVLPPELRGQLEGDWAEPDDLLHLWQTHRSQPDELLARTLTWWAVATLVSNAAHLTEGEATETLQPLLDAFADRSQGLSTLN